MTAIVFADRRYLSCGRVVPLLAADDDAVIVTSTGTAALLNHFVPDLGEEQRRAASVSPLYADLHGLPPTLVSVAARDGLLDDSTFLASRLAYAGVATRLEVWRDCTHVFDTLSPALGSDYATGLAAWLTTNRRQVPQKVR